MKIGEYVLVQLVNPREKFWGLLKDRDGSGLTIRGLSLEGFEGWLHEIARKETVTVLPTTVFLELSIGSLEGAVAVSMLMVLAALVVLVIVRVFGAERLY